MTWASNGPRVMTSGRYFIGDLSGGLSLAADDTGGQSVAAVATTTAAAVRRSMAGRCIGFVLLRAGHARLYSIMINAGIVGLGWWGKNLVEAIQGKSDRLRFVRGACRDTRPVAAF